MAKQETVSNVEFIDDGSEWDTIAEESGEAIKFEKVGDSFTGTFEGVNHVVPKDPAKEEFDQLLFRAADGRLHSTNAGYKLLETFTGEGAPAKGSRVRITLMGEVPITGQPSPMKDFRVEVARNTAN